MLAFPPAPHQWRALATSAQLRITQFQGKEKDEYDLVLPLGGRWSVGVCACTCVCILIKELMEIEGIHSHNHVLKRLLD